MDATHTTDRAPAQDTGRVADRAPTVADALETLSGRKAKALAPFAEQLLEHAAAEDLAALDAPALAALVERAHAAVERHADETVVEVAPLGDDGGASRVLSDASRVLSLVVTDDKPFIVDSCLAEIHAEGHAPLLVVHPVIDGTSCLAVVSEPGPGGAAPETLAEGLSRVMDAVTRATRDWRAMTARVAEEVEHLRDAPPPVPADELAEAIQFLQWLDDDNFTYLGLRSYAFAADGDLRADGEVMLGILSDPDAVIMTRGGRPVAVTPAIRTFLEGPDALFVTKANLRSRVHRRTHLDYIGIKRYDDEGRVVGELRLVGLFTSTAYTRSVRTIPLMRHKAQALLDGWTTRRGGHSAKALANIIESWPRDEFFQASLDTLRAHTRAAVALEERPRVRVLPRVDEFDRFVSVMVYVPRESYDTRARARIGDLLAERYDGHVSAWYPDFLENDLVRVQYVIGREGGATPAVDVAALEEDVRAIVRSWSDRLLAVAREAGVEGALPHFPAGYQEEHAPEAALRDIAHAGVAPGDVAADFSIDRAHVEDHEGDRETVRDARLKLFHRGAPVSLSRRVPLLENMGFAAIEESTFDIAVDGGDVFLHDMALDGSRARAEDVGALERRLEETIGAVWHREAGNDPFNALVLTAGLDWRGAAMFRALALYLRQLRSRFTPNSMARTLAAYPRIAGALAEAFLVKFDPARDGHAERFETAAKEIEAMLSDVASSDDDRILRNFLTVLRGALRTNFFQDALRAGTELPEGVPRPALAFKFDPGRIPFAPKPVPFREIFVSSPRVEGLHLRFGPVARGGIRWSDRAQDYRTEVLGLVKAQQVKNAVIVPVGSKGGFFPHALPPRVDRDAWFEAGRQAYRTYISSMLSITDNLVDDTVAPPPDTVRHDGDDPYFVVAADKGTATFSDTANAISQAYGFWLDDAFASGGSAGYDHKAMGITARGAWEAVKRHFREMEGPDGSPAWDIQSEPFTATGVGDMSGDVFGNGMLLSEETRLIAAFDHRDIFIDPDPDPAASFAERQRLFAMGRSSWADYDRDALSPGGMIVSRQSKTVELTPRAAAAIDLAEGAHPPEEVLRAILKAPVDLLWFGGIGTYIRATTETDAQVGDRANDAIRVAAPEVRAKVIGEGANLGVTQAGRIEYNQHGGRANSDAIDNSGGVNSSDLEVNIKIALARAEREGRLTRERRDELLASMTEAVAELVLRNNYEQTLAISLAEARGAGELPHQMRLMGELEKRDRLDRAVELLPDDAALQERQTAGDGLTRAEIGVLLAYAKIVAFDDLLRAQEVSGVLDDPWFDQWLVGYFPPRMREAYADDIRAHRLRHEIVATQLVNAMMNEGGPTFLSKAQARTQGGIGEIARAFAVAREVLGLEALNHRIDALDTRVAGDRQLELYAAVSERLMTGTAWFLRNTPRRAAVGERVETYRAAVAALDGEVAAMAPRHLTERIAADTKRLAEAGVPEDVARDVARLSLIILLPDIHLVATRAGAKPEAAAKAYFGVTAAFRVERMVQATRDLATDDWFDSLALDQALATIHHARRAITAAVLEAGGDVEQWAEAKGPLVERSQAQIAAMLDGQLTISRLSVAANLLAELARG